MGMAPQYGRPEVRDQQQDFLIERTRIALWVLFGGTLVFTAADLVLAPQHVWRLWAVKMTSLALFAAALRGLRMPSRRRWSTQLALSSTAVGYVVAASSGIIVGQLEITLMLCGVIALGLASSLPWGVAAQVTHVALGAAAVAINAYTVADGTELLFGYPGLTVAILFVASIYLASESQRQTRTQAEAVVNLRDQDHRLRLIVAQMPAALWSTDKQLRVTSVMGAALGGIGISPETAGDFSLYSYFGTDDPKFAPLAAHRAALRGESRSYELRWKGRTLDVHVEPFRGPDGTITGTLGVALDQSDLKEAQERTTTLLEIARDISGTLDRQQILDRVGHRARLSLGCDAVAIFYWDEERRHYRLRSHHGLPAELAIEIATLRVGADAPLVQYLRQHQTAVIDKDTAQDPLPRVLFDRFDVDAVAVTPLNVGDRALGALLALRYAGGPPFTDNQLELLEGIARHVAIAVEVAGLHESVKREGEVSAALARAGRELIGSVSPPELMQRLCRLTVEVLGSDTSCTFLFDPREQVYSPAAAFGLGDERWESLQLVRLPADAMAPLTTRLENNEVVQLVPREDLADHSFGRLASRYGVVAALYVGLRRGDALIGYQVAHLLDAERRFDRQQVDILRGIGGLASLALENAYLVTELERANSVKSDFVATMSHELRTPLNAVIGYNALMREGEFGPLTPEQEKVCSTIDRSSRTLLDLISATLDVSRLDTGQVPLTLADVPVGSLLEALRADVALPKAREVALEWDLAADLPVIRTDGLKLRVIVKNLVENALKFTDRGSVRVTARGADEGIEIVVADTGIGIDAEAQSVIFEPFRQVDGSSTRRHGGVGLGLYIVRRLVGVLGGSVSLSSEPGRGSTFRVWVPQQPSSETRAKPAALAGGPPLP